MGLNQSTVLGYPRIGPKRELKRATEAYWRGRIDADELVRRGAAIRRSNWEMLRDAGITEVPCNDFSFYDQMLDTAQLVGVIPPGLDAYFAAARGTDASEPLEMTKWFDTNYHYLVPELRPDTEFRLNADKPTSELAEAQALGVNARPVVIGPVTFLSLAKPASPRRHRVSIVASEASEERSERGAEQSGSGSQLQPLDLLDRLLPVYAELLQTLDSPWVQLDEPILVTDLPDETLAAVAHSYEVLGNVTGRPKILVATYFARLGEAFPVLRDAPIEGIAVDLTARGGDNRDVITSLPGKRLVAGVVDGRNVWANDLRSSTAILDRLVADEVMVSTSSSLLHVPYDRDAETDIDPDVLPWLAFARQKVDEVVTLQRRPTAGELERSDAVRTARAASPVVHNTAVRERAAAVDTSHLERAPYPERLALQADRLKLPILPTTTIGSFPQTAQIRNARRDLRKGTITPAQYDEIIRHEIADVVKLQEELDIDLLVHGEAERNDMVQYFAEQLDGYLATQHGWVQSYGTRYVRPPILAGDVRRPSPMTVDITAYAQSLTDRPVKGMLTGPVTMLAWSFVRDDLPRGEVAKQVALALRDEVNDLETAGIKAIQVDDPALRETLPLRKAERPEYLAWAVETFRLATSGVRDDTQIHTHMCYAEFGEILDAIAAFDADVISLEAARSHMQIADDLAEAKYQAAVGPGVYDIHAPHVPSVEEITGHLERALQRLPASQLWVNPDCGLKTRTQAEVQQALANLVQAAHQVRRAMT